MHHESVREFCLSLPYTDERVQWGNDLLLCIAKKMFAVLALDGASPYRLSFKCTPEEFADLIEREGIDPAPYVARYHWVALRRFDALPAAELQRLLRRSHELVFEKLPRNVKKQLAQAATRPRRLAKTPVKKKPRRKPRELR